MITCKSLRLGALLALFFLGASAPAFSQKGFYRILGVEPDTRVFFDGEELRDAAGQYPSGTYTLRVEKEGFHSYINHISIFSDQLVEIRIRDGSSALRTRPFRQRKDVRLYPMRGTLVVTSDPPGEPVLLNHEPKGDTPLILENVPVGEHLIHIGPDSSTLTLRIFETRRLRAEEGKILDVTNEDLPPDLRQIELAELALFVEVAESLATDCSHFFTGDGGKIFKLEHESAYVVCRMIFRLASQQPVEMPARFKLYRAGSKIYEVEHLLNIDPAKNNRLCYYHHEFWKPGEYVLTIDGPAGNRLGQVFFTLYF